MKRTIFDEQTSKALKKWHMAVKKKRGGKSPTRTLGNASPTSSMASPLHPAAGPALHRFKTTGHSTRTFTYEDDDDQDVSDMDTADPTTPLATANNSNNVVIGIDGHESENDVDGNFYRGGDENSKKNEDDFSFVKPAPPK